jgi:phosphoribosylformylglycinamidine synthase
MKACVITFPGSNCDHDSIFALSLLGFKVENIWHQDTALPKDIDLVVVPGGFSYGDYLRCGAIARFTPIMQDIVRFAERGGYVIGICNGFQILLETGLLQGTLLRNTCLTFKCCDVYLSVENNKTPFTNKYTTRIIRIPIAHNEGNYFATPEIIQELENNDRIVFRYCNKNGNIDIDSNPNGSINNIAGIINKNGNVLGMMPHPERYTDNILGCDDGKFIFDSILNN